MTCYAPEKNCECVRCVMVKTHHQKKAIRAYAEAGHEPTVQPISFAPHSPDDHDHQRRLHLNDRQESWENGFLWGAVCTLALFAVGTFIWLWAMA